MVEAILSPKKRKKDDEPCESNNICGIKSKYTSYSNGLEKSTVKPKSEMKVQGKEKEDDVEDEEMDEVIVLPSILPPLEIDDGDEYFPEEDEFSFVILKKTI